jgi:4-amino-4-deoxy-L-arabinose transferase-like glycosyltransferase
VFEAMFRGRRSDLIFGTAMGFAVVAAVWLRWSGLDSQSFWADEGYTAWISQFSPKEIWRIQQEADISPPLYYILLHYWSVLLGNSELSLRALSALFATLSLPLFYLVAREILSHRMAVALAMMLYSVSFFQIWYAKEARYYALLGFLSLGGLYCVLRCLEKASAFRLLGFALFLSAGLYTHNMAWLYLPGLAVFWFVYPSEMTVRARIRIGLIVAALVLLSYLPWLPTLGVQLRGLQQFQQSQPFWVPKPRARDLLETLCVLSGFDTRTLQDVFRDHFHRTKLFGFWTWAPAFLVVSVLSVIGALYAVRPANRRKSAALLAYSILPILLAFLDSRLSTPIYINRVFMGACILLPLVFCAPIAFQIGDRQRLFRFLALVVLAGTATSAFGYLRRERREDWRGATEYLLKLPGRPRLAVIISDYGQMVVQYYMVGLFKSYPPIELTGLTTRLDPLTGLTTNFDPPEPGFEISKTQNDRTTDPMAMLARAMGSGRYKEIDLALQPSAALVKDTTNYLTVHCASVEVVEFHWLEVRKCFVQSK